MGKNDNHARFRNALAHTLEDLFRDDAAYAYVARTTTPNALAAKMADALADGTGSHEGRAVRAACKALGVRRTYAAIGAYLNTNTTRED